MSSDKGHRDGQCHSHQEHKKHHKCEKKLNCRNGFLEFFSGNESSIIFLVLILLIFSSGTENF